MTMSGAVAAAAIRSEKRLVQTLKSANALSPQSAIALQGGRPIERGSLRRLLRHKAVVEAGDLYWLDATAYEEMKTLRRSRLFMVMFGVAAVLIIFASVVIAKS